MFRTASLLIVIVTTLACSSSQHLQKQIQQSQKIIGLDFQQKYLDTLTPYLIRNKVGYDSLRKFQIPHETFPAVLFNPQPFNFEMPTFSNEVRLAHTPEVQMPDNMEDLAFYSIAELGALLRSKKISSIELTSFFLERLKKHNPQLQCAITIMEDRALAKARVADQEIRNGNFRSTLHGIPFGTKDLMSVEGYPTTWGARPYQNQVIDHTATVIKKLEDAGAILIAKLTSGALARGDVWFGGQTKNPWDLTQGASGSSAGSGSATSAGLVPFALGTETLGSITSPSNRNGITGLRPTYGRVSRDGVMALSWSMDKVGPMCRNARDCALVFDIIRGVDTLDQTTIDPGFDYNENINLNQLRIAYLKEDIDKDTTDVGTNLKNAIEEIRKITSAKLQPIQLPDSYPIEAFDIILRSESGAMFDELVRSGEVNTMVEQSKRSRANSLRQSRFIPAVEYIQANRVRTLLIQEINELFNDYDVIISPTFARPQLLITNLTGHPVITLPTGLDKKGRPTSITFIGNLYQEGIILAFANAFQRATKFDELHPPLFSQ